MTPAHSRPGPEVPRRSDARRNRERLVDAARAVFAESGPEASLNEIAQRAGVGPGTLYRHFPNRRTLLAAVLRDRIDTLCGHAERLLTADSADRALAEWLHAFLEHARVNQGLGGSLLLHEPEMLGVDCHRRIEDAATALLVRAQRSGTARGDLAPGDLIQLVVGVALATVRGEDAAQPGRLLGLVLDAVHAGPCPAGG
ncbi:TetR/AcrR family transcriptional regulator [Streptomyces sp. XD-27]|uniref:TetR/AcrR family transcriptional regulator n=1 Tax=Streptomyces sp. XD-27 TaxID=3062779 RepID=UPI0026F46C5A|nr:TetR/AcrR family transcriptional regulator [Streptomyces sp. XD-27]WKX69340.1 TetR/AcrR family transcriptional regulator [Streptomyces sp. XD-27]